MINLRFNEEIKAIGSKWNGYEWMPPKLGLDKFEAIERKYFSNMIAIEVTLNDSNLVGEDFGYKHCKTFFGYVLATVSGRDTGARIQEGVAIIEGGFTSGGSVKNYICKLKGETVKLRMEVSEHFLNIIKKSSINYTVLNEERKDNSLEIKQAIKLLEANGYIVSNKSEERQ